MKFSPSLPVKYGNSGYGDSSEGTQKQLLLQVNNHRSKTINIQGPVHFDHAKLKETAQSVEKLSFSRVKKKYF